MTIPEDTFARMRRRMKERAPSRFEIWAWSPVIILRVALVIIYLLYIYCGVIAAIAGAPIFRLTAPEGYATPWGILLALSGMVCAIGSVSEKWNRIERWSSLVLSALMSAYVFGLNGVAFGASDLDRMLVGGVAAIALVLPLVRFVYLASQAGKRHQS